MRPRHISSRQVHAILFALLIALQVPTPAAAGLPVAAGFPAAADRSLARVPGRDDMTYDLVWLLPYGRYTREEALARATHLRIDEPTPGVERVLVVAVAEPADRQATADALTGMGAEITTISQHEGLVQAWLPLDVLDASTLHEDVLYLRAPIPADMDFVPQGEAFDPQTLVASNAQTWHAAGMRGEGVRVLVIDRAFGGYISRLAADLPITVTARTFRDGASLADVDAGDAHGTDCAAVVHAMAPDADLNLAQIDTMLDLEQAVDWAIAGDVDVIATSISWMCQSPGDGTGYLADLVSHARQAGICWVTTAGDAGNNHWFTPWIDVDDDNWFDFATPLELNAWVDENGDPAYLPAGVELKVGLRWDAWASAERDLGLFLVRVGADGAETMAAADSYQNGLPGQQPCDVVSALTYGESARYGFCVERHKDSHDEFVDLYTSPNLGTLLYTSGERSIPSLADALDAITVAAVSAEAPHAGAANGSRGPCKGPSGTNAAGPTKPDLAGYSGAMLDDEPPGTSLAAPSVAGAVALMLGAQHSLSVDQIEALLLDRAVDVGAPGMDTTTGAGRLWLGDPLTALPTPVPTARCLLPLVVR